MASKFVKNTPTTYSQIYQGVTKQSLNAVAV